MPTMEIEGRPVRLTHLERVLYPATGTTKAEVIRYCTLIAPALLPHVHNRPASFLRAPEGVDGQQWFAKAPPAGTPQWVQRASVPRKSGTDAEQVLLQDLPSLLWAANLGCLEIHVPQWTTQAPETVDRLVLDLDPGEGRTVVDCCFVALRLRERLAQDQLTAWVKTSGSKGLHLYVPLEPTAPEAATAYAKAIAADLAARQPERVVTTMAKAQRVGKVFIDWSQNSPKKTTAAPYTLRLREEPTVSTPLSWDEVEAAFEPGHLRFTLDDVPARVEEDGDLLAPLLDPHNARPLPDTPPPAASPQRPRRSAAPGTPPTPARPKVVLDPPVDVVRPQRTGTIPAADALPGGVQYSVKLDGFRAIAFALGYGRNPVLQSRSGRDLAPEFPSLAQAIAQLPAGLVLDGEICAWTDGRLVFSQLLRLPAARARDRVPLTYAAFDVLALPGQDVRTHPLSHRWQYLLDRLDGIGPPIQPVMATLDRDQALIWYDTLTSVGVEGLVCKGLATPYSPRAGWLKIRHSDTTDARLLGITGTPRRPHALLVELDDGTRAVTSPQLSPAHARQLAAALDGHLGTPVLDPDAGPLHPVQPDTTLRVELRVGTERHRTARFVRLRGD